MRSLYDVFGAIKADEGDHVATMKACLDPTVAVSSPSIERRLLTGVALVAAVSLLLTTNDFSADNLDVVTNSVDGVLDTVDSGANIEGETMFEALLAAVVGAANTGKDVLAKEELETEALVEVGPEVLLIALRQAAAQAAKIIGKILFFL
jgi:hypothetical protein